MQKKILRHAHTRVCLSYAEGLDEALATWLQSIVQRFDVDGELLHAGRNRVKRFDVGGRVVVAKRYRRHNALKRLVYSLFRQSKAQRAYANAVRLLSRGYNTPQPVAFVEVWHGAWLVQCYYICGLTLDEPVRGPLIDTEPFDRPLAEAYARFVARMHNEGVLHKDMNPTNVLFARQDGGFRFTLIDINRMRFFKKPVPKRAAMHNLTLFWWLSPVYCFILDVYARERGWSEADQRRAIDVKTRHDRYWRRRKAVKRFLRKVAKVRA